MNQPLPLPVPVRGPVSRTGLSVSRAGSVTGSSVSTEPSEGTCADEVTADVC